LERRLLVLVTGGARSGKSRFAERRLEGLAPAPWSYIATAQPLDAEMEARIATHRQRRGDRFFTIDAPYDAAQALREAKGAGALLDCITLWLSNRLLRGDSDESLLAAADELTASVRVPTVMVTNEVGDGIVPENPLARRFRDLAGLVNQRLAARANEVFLIVSGLPLQLK
jgi:adenosyl cobinamide kinase/adenosyl cobinamide phosphate guanylyltransferase